VLVAPFVAAAGEPFEAVVLEPPPHPAATTVTTPIRSMIFRTRHTTEMGGRRIAGVRNLRGAGSRSSDVWDVSDEALVAGVATGDRDAALTFVRRFQRMVFGCAVAIVGDRGRAEDVAQEAFVRAWRHAEAYDARRGSVATWLMAITRNLAIDTLRVERVRPADVVDVVDLRLVDPDVGPDERAGRSSEVARAMTALRALPEEQRRAVVLASVYGRTAAEISELESIPLGTAKTRVRTGLIRLRSALATEVQP
jgi:RNA polymerase sigma factor (sigma-70 family)